MQKAWIYEEYGPKEVVKLGEIPIPSPKHNQLLVQVHAAALNPIDVKMRQRPIVPACFPVIPGCDMAGVVIEKGEDVSKFDIGDEVYGNIRDFDVDGEVKQLGTLAEFIVVEEHLVALKPKSLSFEEAGSLPVAVQTAIQGFRIAGFKEGQTVFVVGGAGGVGSLVVQLAKHLFRASEVVATTSTAKVKFVKSLGADKVVDYTKTSYEDVKEKYDLVYDTIGESKSSFMVAKDYAPIIDITWPPSNPRAVHSGLIVSGEILENLGPYLESGILKAVIDPAGPFHFSDVPKAFGHLETGRARGKQQRKLASFEFSKRVLRDYNCTIFRRNAGKLVRTISEFSMANNIFDIQDLIMKFTIDSIFKVGFGTDLNCLEGSSKDGATFIKAFDDANALIYWRYVDPTWKLQRFLNIGFEASLKKNINIVYNFVNEVISKKREQIEMQQNYNDKEDILSRFLMESKKDPKKMNDRYLRDIILNFILAGKDTTANTLSWFFYMLCKNPLIQERISQEVREVISSLGSETSIDEFVEYITDDILEKMYYLHAALTETLRLYPAVPVDGRCAEADDTLPDGFKVKKGDNVYYISYAMGRMPKIWGHDAEKFRPERWLNNGIFQPESPFKFIAFHAGPRICLGKDFAYRQMKIVSITLLRYFRFKLADDSKTVTYRAMFTLHVNGGLHLLAIPRTGQINF